MKKEELEDTQPNPAGLCVSNDGALRTSLNHPWLPHYVGSS